jgi:hypothetical protein
MSAKAIKHCGTRNDLDPARVPTFSSENWGAGAVGSAIGVHQTASKRNCKRSWDNVAQDGATDAA